MMVTQLCKFTKTDLICILQMGKFYAIVNYTLERVKEGEISKEEVVSDVNSLEGIFLK